MKAFYDNEPSTMEAVGNGDWYYRQNIEELTFTDETGDRKQWGCDEYVISGVPEYGKCVSAVIRSKYDIDAELALVNKYNSYKQGIIDDASIEEEYATYLTFVKEVKKQVKDTLGQVEEAANDAPDVSQSAKAKSVADGTKEAPIAYSQGIALEKGKYYVQYGVVYICIQSSGAQVYDLYQIPSIVTPVD